MKETRIIIWSIIAITLTVLLIYGIVNGGKTGFVFWKDYKIVYEETISSENIENLNIDWRSGNVNIYVSDNNEIKIIQKAYADLDDNKKVQVSTTNNTLTLKEGKNKFNFFVNGFVFMSNLTVLDVYLPEKLYNDINLKCSSGEIYVTTLSCTNFKINVSSGEVNIDNIITEKAKIDITSGEINVNNIETNILDSKTTSGSIMIAGTAKNVDLQATSGEISFENNILPESLNVDVTSGDIEIIIPENEGFNVDYKITSGDFDSDFDLYSNISKSGNGKYKDGGDTFTFKLTSGKINLIKK